MAFGVYDDVVGLQVPEYNFTLMQVLNRKNNLRRVYLRYALIKFAFLFQEGAQVTILAVVQY